MRAEAWLGAVGGVIGEAMVAIVMAKAFLEKCGGDSLGEKKRKFDGYKEQVQNY